MYLFFCISYGDPGSPPQRKHFDELRALETNLVELDGVGSACLLIHADLHREGLNFPPYVFKHQIESEGLGRMAKAMGYQPYGTTNIEVIHS